MPCLSGAGELQVCRPRPGWSAKKNYRWLHLWKLISYRHLPFYLYIIYIYICIIFSNIYHVHIYICTLYIFISVIHILQTYHFFLGGPNFRDGSFSWSDFSGAPKNGVLEAWYLGATARGAQHGVLQHLGVWKNFPTYPWNIPQIPNQQVYEGNSLYFEIWGCLNYVLGVCWGSLGGLISSWIVWVKNVVYPPVLSWNSLFYGGCEEEFPFPLAGYVSCLDGYYSWMVNKIIEVGKRCVFFCWKGVFLEGRMLW